MFAFETPYLDLEIYRLVTILEASPALADFDGRESDKRKLEFLRGWEFPEVSRIVVSLAAGVRTALNADPGGGGSYSEALERQVGTLFPDESNPQSRRPLRFREACNKVLHADHVDPETTAVTGGVREPLTGRLVLYGRYRGKNWRAELDLKEYALSALALSP
jgi:hypothetical protein